MPNLPLKDLLSLTVLAAIVSTAGALVALLLKEWFFARSFERWKDKRELERIYRRYRDPIVLAATELAIRLKELVEGDGRDYVRSAVFQDVPAHQVSPWASDPYYLRYKLESTVFRLCSLLGWLELYRQDVSFLRTGSKRTTRLLGERIKAVREDLADGQLNDAPNWYEWRDYLIFREEQRAIGESMIVDCPNGRQVMGYAEFNRLFRARQPAERATWVHTASEFLADMGSVDLDFRLVRTKALYVHLIDLTRLLDSEYLTETQEARRERYASELPTSIVTGLTFATKDQRVKSALAWMKKNRSSTVREGAA